MTKDPNTEILTASEFAVEVAKKDLGKTLDYSINSLKDLEALIQHVKNHFLNLKGEGKLTEQTVQRASISIGGYLGEVIRRSYGGTWVAKNTIMKVLVIDGQEFSPILYIFQSLTKDVDYSPDKYYSEINQRLRPQEDLNNNSPISEIPKEKVSGMTGNSNLKVKIIAISLLIIAGIGFGWYYSYGPCGTQLVKKAALELIDSTQRFGDAHKVADSTPRIALSTPISDMQEIKRAAMQIKVPACLDNSKNWYLDGMQNYIDGYIAFMGEANDSEVNLYIATGDLYFSATANEINYISKCAPFCKTDPNKAVP